MGCGNPSFRGGNRESLGANPGRQACETERAYGVHVKECINECPLQRVPRLRGG